MPRLDRLWVIENQCCSRRRAIIPTDRGESSTNRLKAARANYAVLLIRELVKQLTNTQSQVDVRFICF